MKKLKISNLKINSSKWNILLILSILIAILALVIQLKGRNENYSWAKQPILQRGDSIELPKFFHDIYGHKIDCDGTILLINFDPNCASCLDDLLFADYFYQKNDPRVKIIALSNANTKKIAIF